MRTQGGATWGNSIPLADHGIPLGVCCGRLYFGRAKIFESVVGRPIMEECLGSRRRRGSPAHLNWWEQKMDLDLAAEEEEDDDDDGWPLPPPRQDGDMEGADDPIV